MSHLITQLTNRLTSLNPNDEDHQEKAEEIFMSYWGTVKGRLCNNRASKIHAHGTSREHDERYASMESVEESMEFVQVLRKSGFNFAKLGDRKTGSETLLVDAMQIHPALADFLVEQGAKINIRMLPSAIVKCYPDMIQKIYEQVPFSRSDEVAGLTVEQWLNYIEKPEPKVFDAYGKLVPQEKIDETIALLNTIAPPENKKAFKLR